VAALALRGALSGAAADAAPDASAQPRWALLGGATVLASVSAYLMGVLAGPLGGQACPYCIASAALSAGTLAAALRGFSGDELRRAAAPGVALAAAVVLAVGLPQARAQKRVCVCVWLLRACCVCVCVRMHFVHAHTQNPHAAFARVVACARQAQASASAAAQADIDLPFREPEARAHRLHPPPLARLRACCMLLT
jgi:hypothetical protein